MKKPTKRPTIGQNPLDALMPPPRGKNVPPPPPGRTTKLRATFHLSEPLFEEVRDCVVFLSGPPHRLTLAGFAEEALREKVEAMKKAANKGKPFPKRDGQIRGGRPIGS